MFEMGGEHFANYCIDDREVEGFVDYVRDLEVLVLRVRDTEGELVLTDVSILLPKYNQLYGSFCQWNRAHKNRSPGIYACLQACRWAAKNGLRYYNLGPVDDYGYKSLFVTDFEPIYAMALIDKAHPLVTDPTSPLVIDFKPHQFNQIFRDEPAAAQTDDTMVLAMVG
jgi:arginyl-tRNA--protein-N-Asp/Glu arginylyltransferase